MLKSELTPYQTKNRFSAAALRQKKHVLIAADKYIIFCFVLTFLGKLKNIWIFLSRDNHFI